MSDPGFDFNQPLTLSNAWPGLVACLGAAWVGGQRLVSRLYKTEVENPMKLMAAQQIETNKHLNDVNLRLSRLEVEISYLRGDHDK